MRADFFYCDMCGRKLDQHRDRYILRFQSVPTYRDGRGTAYDLCPCCTKSLMDAMDEHRQRQFR